MHSHRMIIRKFRPKILRLKEQKWHKWKFFVVCTTQSIRQLRTWFWQVLFQCKSKTIVREFSGRTINVIDKTMGPWNIQPDQASINPRQIKCMRLFGWWWWVKEKETQFFFFSSTLVGFYGHRIHLQLHSQQKSNEKKKRILFRIRIELKPKIALFE